MRVRDAAHRIGQQRQPARTEIDVTVVQVRLVEGGKIIRHCQPVGRRELQHTVAEVIAGIIRRVRAESAVARLEI